MPDLHDHQQEALQLSYDLEQEIEKAELKRDTNITLTTAEAKKIVEKFDLLNYLIDLKN